MSKDIYIEFILDCFRNGISERAEILKLFLNKWNNKSSRTFDRRFKSSKEIYKHENEEKKAKIKEIELIESISNVKENLDLINSSLLSIIKKEQLVEEKAYDITIGKVVVYYREPSPMEIIEAIKEYNRINGI
jgi:hypothetical protein